MVDNRIILRLDERIEFERDFGARYRAIPRARRQEWIRTVLRAGLAGLDGAAEPTVAPVRVAAPVSAPAPTPMPVVDAAPARAVTPAPVKTGKNPKASESLAGFFGT